MESELEAAGEPPIEVISKKLGKKMQSTQDTINTHK
jgi:hypothetical protein